MHGICAGHVSSFTVSQEGFTVSVVASDTKEQRTELQRSEEHSERITGGKKEGKVETNLTSQRDLQADERAQRNAPVRDDREQKSYGKENCRDLFLWVLQSRTEK
ncbi:hypothetical protein D4764_01G0003640 [Takifugu flavidus]|uniref:Uncharacterized protein n=1 Tax=Takifugu flavidus TaxID=433684 RepID=A0A5C6PNL8_9TELE|nr:hypothetical protein D4764_01G0003640 [Takifugu flavidus]